MILKMAIVLSRSAAVLAKLLFLILERFPTSQKTRIFLSERKASTWREAVANAARLVTRNQHKKIYWVHVASAGELEQVIPTLRMLHSKYGVGFFLTYFSPSAKAFVENCPGLVGSTSLPLENKLAFQHAISSLKIARLVLVRYDFWPVLMETFKENQLPVCILAATLRKAKSSLPTSLRNSLRKTWFNQADSIFLIEASEKEPLFDLGVSKEKIIVSGDAKWIRARERATNFHQKNLSPAIQSIRKSLVNPVDGRPRRTIVFGSPHAEELKILIQLLENRLQNKLFIIAPPEVDANTITKLENLLSSQRVRILKISDGNRGLWPSELCLPDETPVLILDTFGQLAEAYGLAEIAVVGGGFDGQLHNVLEPAALPVATVFGDKTERAPEAQILLANNAALSFAKQEMLFQFLRGWSTLGIDDEECGNLERKLNTLRQNSASLFASLPDPSEVVCQALASKDALEAF